MMTRRQLLRFGAVGLWQPARASHVVASGQLTAAEHEAAEGYWAVGQHCAIQVRPTGTPQQVLREYKGKTVELVIREATE